MTRRRPPAAAVARSLFPALLCAAALVGPSAAKEPAKKPRPAPLFREFHVNPVDFTLSAIGTGAIPRTGPLSASAMLAVALDTGAAPDLPGKTQIGTTTAILSGFPSAPGAPNVAALSGLAILRAGHQFNCWELIDTSRFRPLPRDWLAQIEDRKDPSPGSLEVWVYSKVIVWANFTSSAALAKAARRDITRAHLISEPENHRGRVLHIEGTLRRINRFTPPADASFEGVNDCYVGWVFPEALGTAPYKIIFTEWPADLPRSVLGQEKLDVPVKVAFDGYFFKTFSYEGTDPRRRQQEAPLLIGHGLTVLQYGATEGGRNWAGWLLYALVGGLSGLILTVVGLTWFFRRSDTRIHRRLFNLRHPEFVLPPPDAPPVAAPVAPPVRQMSGSARPAAFPSRINLPPPTSDRPGESPSGGDRPKGGPPERPPDEGAGP